MIYILLFGIYGSIQKNHIQYFSGVHVRPSYIVLISAKTEWVNLNSQENSQCTIYVIQIYFSCSIFPVLFLFLFFINRSYTNLLFLMSFSEFSLLFNLILNTSLTNRFFFHYFSYTLKILGKVKYTYLIIDIFTFLLLKCIELNCYIDLEITFVYIFQKKYILTFYFWSECFFVFKKLNDHTGKKITQDSILTSVW